MPNIVIHGCWNIIEKLTVLRVWPAHLALFVYDSTHKTVKSLDFNLSDCGARGPGFDFLLWQGILFAFMHCCCSTFLVQKPLYVIKFCNSCCDVISFSILNILQNLWPIIRVSRYRHSIFKTFVNYINILYPKSAFTSCLCKISKKTHL